MLRRMDLTPYQEKLTRYRKPAIIAGAVLFGLLLLSQLLVAMIDAEAALKPLREQVRALSGQPLIVGDVSVGILSGPKITVDGVALRNPMETDAPFLLRADTLILSFGLFDALFSDKPALTGITLVRPRLELERNPRGRPNWEFLRNIEAGVDTVEQLKLVLQNGTLHYTNHQTEQRFTVSGVSGELNVGSAHTGFDFRATLQEKQITASGACSIARFSGVVDFDVNCKGDLSGEDLTMVAEQRLLLKQGRMQSRGSLTLQTGDLRGWGDAFFSQSDQVLQQYFAKALPLNVSLESYSDDERAILNLTGLEVGASVGKASLTYHKSEAAPELKLAGVFERLDTDELAGLIAQSSGTERDMFALADGFDPKLGGSLQLHAGEWLFAGLSMRDLKVQGAFGAGELAITDAQAALPGEGVMVSLGRVSASSRGLQYDGLIELSGASLAALVPALGMEPGEAFRRQFTQYRARVNVIMSPASTILSELRLVAGEGIRIAGGMEIHEDAEKGISGALAMENIDFDPFYRDWLGDASLLAPPPEQMPPEHPFTFSWLADIERPLRLRLELKRFRFLDREGANSALELKAETGRVAIGPMRVTLGDMKLQGKVELARSEDRPRPFITSRLNLSRLDIGNALRADAWDTSEATPGQRDLSVWSKQPIQLNPLRYFDGYHELRIRRVEHEITTINGLRGIIEIKDQAMTFRDIGATLWQGRLAGQMALDVRTLPGMKLEFRLENANIAALLDSAVDFDNLNGLASLQLNASTSGINPSDWVGNMRGTLGVKSENLFVRHFNLPAIVRTVQSVRVVSGLANALRQAFASGSSRFDSLDGQLFFEDGKLAITEFNLHSNESVGQMTGHLDLLNWRNQLHLRLGLVALARANYPYLGLTFTGPIHEPQRRLDLKSIESYLAQTLR